jgi:hypothetical protein
MPDTEKNGECFIETTHQLNLVPRCHFMGKVFQLYICDWVGSGGSVFDFLFRSSSVIYIF